MPADISNKVSEGCHCKIKDCQMNKTDDQSKAAIARGLNQYSRKSTTRPLFCIRFLRTGIYFSCNIQEEVTLESLTILVITWLPVSSFIECCQSICFYLETFKQACCGISPICGFYFITCCNNKELQISDQNNIKSQITM